MDELVAGDQVIGFINSVKLSYLKYIILCPAFMLSGYRYLLKSNVYHHKNSLLAWYTLFSSKILCPDS